MKKILLLFIFLLYFLNLNAQYSTLGNNFWVSFMQNFDVVIAGGVFPIVAAVIREIVFMPEGELGMDGPLEVHAVCQDQLRPYLISVFPGGAVRVGIGSGVGIGNQGPG